MKIVAILLTILATCMLLFGAWGRFTAAGRIRFDEMAGMIPFFSWYVGIIIAVVAFVLWGIILMKNGS